MNVSGIVGKIAAKSDLIFGLLGFGTGSSYGLGDVQSSIENIIAGNVHAPDMIGLIKYWLQTPYFTNALGLYLTGWACKEFKVPVIGKYGNALQKAGTAYGAGSLLNHLLYDMTHSGKTGGSSGSFGGMQGYSY